MRYLLIILSLLSFSLCQFIPSDEDIAKMSSFEKQMLYEKNDKSPVGAFFLNIIPTLGYAYIDDWERGLYLKGAQIVSLWIGAYIQYTGYENIPGYYSTDVGWVSGQTKEDDTKIILGGIMMWASIGLVLYEPVDLYKQTNKYNEQLHNKIFSKKDKKLSYLLLPTLDGAYLNLSYKF